MIGRASLAQVRRDDAPAERPARRPIRAGRRPRPRGPAPGRVGGPGRRLSEAAGAGRHPGAPCFLVSWPWSSSAAWPGRCWAAACWSSGTSRSRATPACPAARVRAASGIKPGTPLARLDAAAAVRRVEGLSRVLSAQVSRSWPDTVVISVRVRRAALAVAGGGGFELVDALRGGAGHGGHAGPPGLPLLRPAPALLRGSAAVRAAADVLGELPAGLRQRVLSVSAPSADEVTLRLRGRLTVRWGSAGPGPAEEPGTAGAPAHACPLLRRQLARRGGDRSDDGQHAERHDDLERHAERSAPG